MIPQLYDSSGTYLICWLVDTVKCTVSEEKNSTYELTLEYAKSGKYAELLKHDMLISCKANQTTVNQQFFKIYHIESNLKGSIVVKAEHISYGMRGFAVPMAQNYSYNSIASIVTYIKNNSYFGVGNYNITGQAFNNSYTLSLDGVKNVANLFLGDDGLCKKHSLLAYRDNLNIKLLAQQAQGQSYPQITYGVNLADYKCIVDKSDVYNYLLPYYVYDDNGTKKVITIVNNSPSGSAWHWRDSDNFVQITPLKAGEAVKCYLLNMADYIGADYINDTIKMQGSINFTPAAQNYIEQNKSVLTDATVVTTVDFVNLADTENYKNIAPLQKIGMHSIVNVNIPHMSISSDISVVSYSFDVLNERYDSMTLGNVESKLSVLYAQTANRQSIINNNLGMLPSLIYSAR